MDIIVSGRHVVISDEVRDQVSERIATVERFRDRVQRVEVQFTLNETKGSHEDDLSCEITLRSKGPVVRAEGSASDKMRAFDKAMDRLKTQLRKASDRRKHHKGLRQAAGHGAGLLLDPVEMGAGEMGAGEAEQQAPEHKVVAGVAIDGDGPLDIREKEFEAAPLTMEQALDEMELVGHDFFLYQDADTGRPSVVYRRRGYSYGVIHLNVSN